MSHQEHERDHGTDPAKERVRRALEHAAEPDPDRRSQERNSAIAIAALALLVVLLLLAIVSGATDIFSP